MVKAKVGNLAAGSGAKIRLTYVTELKVEGGEIRFYLPTTIAPRYIPSSDNSSAAADLAKINYTPLVTRLYKFDTKLLTIYLFINCFNKGIALSSGFQRSGANGIGHQRNSLAYAQNFS